MQQTKLRAGQWRGSIYVAGCDSRCYGTLTLVFNIGVGGCLCIWQLVPVGTYPLLFRQLNHVLLQSLTFLVLLLVVFCSHVQPQLQVLHLPLQLCYKSWICFLLRFGLLTQNMTTRADEIPNTVKGPTVEVLCNYIERKVGAYKCNPKQRTDARTGRDR